MPLKGSPIVRLSKSGHIFPKLFSEVPSRAFQMVRMARLGLAMAPTLSLKVLTSFRLALPTGYERI